jgi:hypothetical protein
VIFSGGSHLNYVLYLLDIYCLVRYEATEDLKNALFNNWLVNLTGELGKWIEGDLMQEHFNRWVEDMVQKHGGNFNDPFYRYIIAPNVYHFLRLKESICDAYGLERRSLGHTFAQMNAEIQGLLSLYHREELHSFCSRRTLGHCAKNSFAVGYAKLRGGKLHEYLQKSQERAKCLSKVTKQCSSSPTVSVTPTPSALESPTAMDKESPEIPDAAESDDELNLGSNSLAPSSTLSLNPDIQPDNDFKYHSDASDSASNTSGSSSSSCPEPHDTQPWEELDYIDQRSGSDNAVYVLGEKGDLLLEHDIEIDEEEPDDLEVDNEEENFECEPFEEMDQ